MNEKDAFEGMADQGLSDIWINKCLDTDLLFLRVCVEYKTDNFRRLEGWNWIGKAFKGEVYYLVCDVVVG